MLFHSFPHRKRVLESSPPGGKDARNSNFSMGVLYNTRLLQISIKNRCCQVLEQPTTTPKDQFCALDEGRKQFI